MNTINKAFLAFLALTLVGLVTYAGASDRSMIKSVQSGETSLSCHIGNDNVAIDPELVIGYDSIQGWIFTNGSAKNCRVTVRS